MNKCNLLKIKTLCQQKGITLTKVAKAGGVTLTGLGLMIKENAIRTDVLIKIADELGEPVTIFFDTDQSEGVGCNGTVGGDFMVNSRKEAGLAIEALIDQLKVKDQQIDKLLKTLKK